MPTVPYIPYPTAEPTTQGTPSLRINTPSEAFGVGIGKALSAFGEGLERDADKIFNRAVALQELQNETEARNTGIQMDKEVAMLHADFNSRQGVNAGPGALEKYTKDLDGVYQKYRGGMSNDDARRRYDAFALSVVKQAMNSGAGHSAIQTKEAAKGSSMALIDQAADNIYNSALTMRSGVPVNLEEMLATTRKAAADYSALAGMDPNAAKTFSDKAVSKIISHMITGVAQNRPYEADQLLEKYGSMLHGDDQLRVRNTVEQRNRAITSRIEVDKIMAPIWNLKEDERIPTEKELRDKVDAMADKAAPSDPLFKDAARNYLMAQYGRIRTEQRNIQFANIQTIKDGIVGAFTAGKIPSIDEFREIPEVKAAMARLSPARQYDMEQQLARIIAQGDRIAPYASLRRRQYYEGMANSENEEDRRKFLGSGIIDDRGLNVNDMKHLIQLQKTTRNRAEADVNMSHAMSVLAPDMQAAGVKRGTDGSTDRDNYYLFLGVLRDRISEAQGTKGKRLNEAEIKEIGRSMLQRDAYKGWLGFLSGETDPRFIREAPKPDQIDEFIETYKRLYPDQRVPNRDEAARQLLGMRLRALDAKPKGKPSE
jgi:hypothetical protein